TFPDVHSVFFRDLPGVPWERALTFAPDVPRRGHRGPQSAVNNCPLHAEPAARKADGGGKLQAIR
ncbi:MAG TPA: hypothetical protein VFW55_11315, partial [Propionicimonas sp.]|nr:hypothetical protein [Propionicimonas sp.]